ncbi:fumarylacetoacetate hydrolase family protein [Saccharopolyspora sp. WRP15-2]|uniref:Fumarylacetoacetate hydrolase family protein n=1 Tax=Saccharopolyspora oryzae TaxID=2997343 RepID=A0ABT4US72_9PSEU|nr:fumarylacetoacetate hydrolase family protein [Saccharopolyspora oryzae]MDA3624565.1 fumarylacetoacetate hydrolase family protein [Saccharopolyspora oryzae]
MLASTAGSGNSKDLSIADAVARLSGAERTGTPAAPVRDVLGDTDIALAYAVQQELVRQREDRGAVPVGRKIGLTSPAVQRQMGVDQPDFGVLFADMDVSGRAEIPSGRLLQPRVEAEIAFVLAEDLADGELDAAQVRAAVDHAVPALEIVDSRITGWDIAITDTIADNASSGLFVLADRRLPLDEFEPRDTTMRLYADDELVSEGSGAACLGDPLAALAWLARTARSFGDPLRAGQIVLSGALGPLVPAKPGMRFRAEIDPLGEVTTTFSEGSE